MIVGNNKQISLNRIIDAFSGKFKALICQCATSRKTRKKSDVLNAFCVYRVELTPESHEALGEQKVGQEQDKADKEVPKKTEGIRWAESEYTVYSPFAQTPTGLCMAYPALPGGILGTEILMPSFVKLWT